MKVLTGTIREGSVVLDQSPGLPERTRVRVVIEVAGPDFDESQLPVDSDEELDHVRAVRGRLARIDREECG